MKSTELSSNPVLSTQVAVEPATAAGAWSIERLLLLMTAIIVVIRAFIHIRTCWITDAAIDHPSGVMIAMASDLAHGVFYRPLFGPMGYGGTRYFPLYFVLQAALLKLHVPVLLATYLLSFSALFFLVAGTFYLLREIGVDRLLAAVVAATLVASVSVQSAIVSAHADGLASALNIWALITVLRPKPDTRRIVLAALLFTLAWSAKFTTVFGVTTAVLWLLGQGQRRRALQLGALTALGYCAVAASMVVFSGGRVIDIFRACALGGAGMQRLLAGPLFMTWNAMSSDLTIFLLLFFALTLLAATILDSPVRCFRQFTVIFFIATLATTAVIYGSPGTNLNHLLDVQVAATLLLAWVASRPAPLQKKMGTYALVLALLIPVSISFGRAFLHHRADVVVADPANRLQQVVAMVERSGKPVLAENPVIPVLANEPAYVLDPWMFSLLRKHNSDFEVPLMERLRSQSFGMVVLLEDPETDYGRDWYTHQHFGPGFIPALEQNYRLLSATDSQFIYVPKNRPGDAER